MKQKIIIALVFLFHLPQLNAKICVPGIVCAKITVQNTAQEQITVIATRIGCAGTSEGETVTCRTKKIAPGKSETLDIKYPYTGNYNIIVHKRGKKYELEKTRDGSRAAEDKETIIFPQDFGPQDWILPIPNLRYDQTAFAVAHNAFSSRDEGWKLYQQQNRNIPGQLLVGIRGFMLDTYYYEKKVVLCHQSCGIVSALQKMKGGGYQTLQNALAQIKDFLDKNPKEIITVFLENKVKNDILKKDIHNVSGLANMILSKQVWDPNKHNGEWPTLAWMQKNNKRLVMFNEDKSQQVDPKNRPVRNDDPFFATWDYLFESQYGTFDKEKSCTQRKESAASQAKNRSLYLFNWFGTVAKSAADSRKANSSQRLMNQINYCKSKGLANGKSPNFIAVDFADKGNVTKVVNILNTPIAKNTI